MPQYHVGLRKKKKSGGTRRPNRKKRKHEKGNDPVETVKGDAAKRKRTKVRGGNEKFRLRTAQEANVADPETGKVVRTPIQKVASNPANRDYDRRGVITKGAVIETELGKAVVTSRPGQHGIVHARLIES